MGHTQDFQPCCSVATEGVKAQGIGCDRNDSHRREAIFFDVCGGDIARCGFGFDRAQVVSALTLFAGLSHVVMAEPDRVAAAIESLDQGMDFADALHLAGAAGCEAFVTFDKRLIKAATTQRLGIVREP